MLKQLSLYTVSIIVLAVVQHFTFAKLMIFGASPDLLAVLIAYVSVTVGQRTGTTYGFAAGLIAGFLSGNMGLSALVGTIEGFAAGFFHMPEESRPTRVKTRRMFYYGSGTALACGNLALSILNNPMGLSPWLRIPAMVILGTLMSLVLTVLFYQLILKNISRA